MKKTAKRNENRIDYKVWLKSQIGMLPSHDRGVDVYCPRCHARRLQADFTKPKPYFRCLSCRRTSFGLWDYLATFNRNLSGLRLPDAKRHLDSNSVDYSEAPDEICFPGDILQHEREQEAQARDQRIAERRRTYTQNTPTVESLQRRIDELEARVSS